MRNAFTHKFSLQMFDVTASVLLERLAIWQVLEIVSAPRHDSVLREVVSAITSTPTVSASRNVLLLVCVHWFTYADVSASLFSHRTRRDGLQARMHLYRSHIHRATALTTLACPQTLLY